MQSPLPTEMRIITYRGRQRHLPGQRWLSDLHNYYHLHKRDSSHGSNDKRDIRPCVIHRDLCLLVLYATSYLSSGFSLHLRDAVNALVTAMIGGAAAAVFLDIIGFHNTRNE